MSVLSLDSGTRSPAGRAPTWSPAVEAVESVSQTLALSELRTYDAALETLGAYKLTGNFVVDLEIVLKDLRVRDDVTFEIKPKALLSDCRQVRFRPAANVESDRFAAIVRAVARRIGAEPARPWWVRFFQ